MAGSLLFPLLTGCGPSPVESKPVVTTTIPPVISYGIFNGVWRHGDHMLYDIAHKLGKSPVVLAPSNAFSRSEIDNVSYRGRKMEFDQIEYAAEDGDEAALLENRTVYAATGTVWHVTLRVAINNPHTVLLEKTDSVVTLSCLLTRMPRSARDATAWTATNAWPIAVKTNGIQQSAEENNPSLNPR